MVAGTVDSPSFVFSRTRLPSFPTPYEAPYLSSEGGVPASQVFSWGSWARGRLGLGMPPERTTRGKKRVPRFQVTPRRISGFGSAPVVQVRAGADRGSSPTGNMEGKELLRMGSGNQKVGAMRTL